MQLVAARDVRDVEGLGLRVAAIVGAREAAAARDPHDERARSARAQRLGGRRVRVGREEVARDGRERPPAVRADLVVVERRDGGLDVVLPPGTRGRERDAAVRRRRA
jgi:hypothetical protein